MENNPIEEYFGCSLMIFAFGIAVTMIILASRGKLW